MTYGKKIENNVQQSLTLAGVEVDQSQEMDLNQKIDCLVKKLDGKKVRGGLGIQISLKRDPVKVKVSKQLALNSCGCFVYLLVSDSQIFDSPTIEAGMSLKKLLMNMLPSLSRHKAMMLEVGRKVQTQTI